MWLSTRIIRRNLLDCSEAFIPFIFLISALEPFTILYICQFCINAYVLVFQINLPAYVPYLLQNHNLLCLYCCKIFELMCLSCCKAPLAIGPNCCRALSAYAYLGAHNLYIEETGRLVIYTQASFATPLLGHLVTSKWLVSLT